MAHPPRKPGRKKRAARHAREAGGEPIVAIAATEVIAMDAQVAASADIAADVGEPVRPAIVLPVAAEPLVVTVPEPDPVATAECGGADVPRHRAVTRPQRGLIAAISAWLRSSRKLLLLGLLPRRKRVALPKPPRDLPIALQRPREELEQLRDENHDLRRKLAAFEAERGRRLVRG